MQGREIPAFFVYTKLLANIYKLYYNNLMLKKRTLEYYDWEEIQNEVEKLLKHDIRDYDGMFGKKKKLNAEYKDFWHWWLDRHEVKNGGLDYINFAIIIEENQGEPEWILEILNAFKTVLGNDGDKDITVMYSW